MTSRVVLPTLLTAVLFTQAYSAVPVPAFTTVNKGYDRVKSTVLVRKVALPTRANLDAAAFNANVMLYDTASCEIKAPAGTKKLKDLNFNGTLVSATVADRLEKLPLSAAEKAAPLSWPALKEYLLKWDFEKSQKLVEMLTGVSEEKWENEELCKPAQEPAEMYLQHRNGKTAALWIKVEFRPWIKFLKAADDEDKDGFPEIYGQISPEFVNPEMFAEIDDRYTKIILTKEEVVTWSNELASFWYPTFNTDNYKYEGRVWPDKYVEPEIVKALNGLTFDNPLIAIKGKPFGYPLYQLILVEGMQQENAAPVPVEAVTAKAGAGRDASVAGALVANGVFFKQELEKNSGSYESWAAAFKPFYDGLKTVIASAPEEVKGFEGKEQFLFFRNSFNYILGGDLGKQAAGKNPVPIIVAMSKLMNSLGVDFLFVPAPVKPEIYPELTGAPVPSGKGAIVNPYSRKFLKELTDAGVEVIDIYTPILAEKAKACAKCEPVYQRQDTHWGDRGLEAAAKALAERIKKYGWFKALPVQKYTVRDTTFNRTGDIVSRLAASQQTKYKPDMLKGAMVVNPDNTLYDGDKKSPILLLGDSFLGVYEQTDCRHAGVSAHIAKELGVPVSTLVNYGGGPTIAQKVKRMGKAGLANRKLVVWLMVARDLYNYHEDWEKIEALE